MICAGCTCPCKHLRVSHDPASFGLRVWQWESREEEWQPVRVTDPAELRCRSCREGPSRYQKRGRVAARRRAVGEER